MGMTDQLTSLVEFQPNHLGFPLPHPTRLVTPKEDTIVYLEQRKKAIASYYAWLPRALRQHAVTRLLRVLPEGFWYKSLSHRLRWLHCWTL